MLRIVYKLSLVLIVGVLLVACGNGNGNDESNKSSEDTVKISFGHDQPETNVRHEAAVKFKDLVEEKSDGKITVEIFPNGTLGSEPENIENVSLDNLEMALAGTSIYTQYDPKMGAVNLPYLFDSYEHAWKVLDGEIGDLVSEPLLDNNIRILSFFENGMRHVTNSKKAINSPEDLKGLNIRTPEGSVAVDTMNAMGGSPTPMAFGELYLALQQGTVDGQENPLANIYSANLYEVQEFLSLTGHQYDALPLAISDKFWEGLSEDYQKIIQDAALESAQFHREAIKNSDDELLEKLKAEGVEVNDVDMDEFRVVTQGVVDDYANIAGEDFLVRFLEVIENER